MAESLALSWIRDVHPSTKRSGGRDRKFEVSKEASIARAGTYAHPCILRITYITSRLSLSISLSLCPSSPVRSDGPRDTMRPLIFRRGRAVSFLYFPRVERHGEVAGERRARRKYFPGSTDAVCPRPVPRGEAALK